MRQSPLFAYRTSGGFNPLHDASAETTNNITIPASCLTRSEDPRHSIGSGGIAGEASLNVFTALLFRLLYFFLHRIAYAQADTRHASSASADWPASARQTRFGV